MDSLRWRCILAALAGVVFEAIFFWKFLPYSQRESASHPAILPIYAAPLLAFVLALLLTRRLERRRQLIPISIVGGWSVANIVLIVIDCQQDPTNHNLLPFEFVMIFILTAPAFLGAVLGGLWNRRET